MAGGNIVYLIFVVVIAAIVLANGYLGAIPSLFVWIIAIFFIVIGIFLSGQVPIGNIDMGFLWNIGVWFIIAGIIIIIILLAVPF